MKISPEWLAGFFDGEGCISATRVGKNKRVTIRVQLVNTNEILLLNLQAQYGGIFVKREQKSNLDWKPFCALLWTSKKAQTFLSAISPFLILKKPQAELAKEFYALKSHPRRFICASQMGVPVSARTFRRKLSPEAEGLETEIKDRFHLLNRKGVA